MSDRIAIFPLTREIVPIIEYCQEVSKLNKVITTGITFDGLVLLMKSLLKGVQIQGITDACEDEVIRWEELYIVGDIIPNDEFYISLADYLIVRSKNLGKRITVFNASDSLYNRICEIPNVKFVNTDKLGDIMSEKIGTLPYDDITIPVLFVGGMIKSENEKRLSLRVKTEIEKEEKRRVIVLLEKDYVELNEVYSYSKWLSLNEFNKFDDVILQLNQNVREIIKYEQPDLLVVELPTSVMKYSDTIIESFGIDTYIFTEAISPGFLLLNTPVQYVNRKMLDEISNFLYKRFNLPISMVCVNEMCVDIMESMQNRKIMCVALSKDAVHDCVNSITTDSNFPICSYENIEPIICFIRENILWERKKELLSYNDEPVDVEKIILEIVNSLNDDVKYDAIDGEWKNLDLCGNIIKFTAVDLIYLLFEIEKRFDVFLPRSVFDDYGFNTFKKICMVVEDYLANKRCAIKQCERRKND